MGWPSTAVNVVRAGYSHFYQSFLSVDSNVDPVAYGINTGVANPKHFGFRSYSLLVTAALRS